MLFATTVSSEDELLQVHRLNQQNLKQFLSEEEKTKEGFVTWLYSMELLQKMHNLAPSVIAKQNDKVVGYALVTPQEAGAFHTDLNNMIENLKCLAFLDKSLFSYSFYIMGQICIQKEYRGEGVFNLLYDHHKKVYSKQYELLVTEISSSNTRSLKAHERIGFTTIHTYRDAVDEWNVVVWDWNKP